MCFFFFLFSYGNIYNFFEKLKVIVLFKHVYLQVNEAFIL